MNDSMVEVWAVGIGILPVIRTRKVRTLLRFISSLDGFLGISPVPHRGTLLVFKSKNDATCAKKTLEKNGVHTGNELATVYIKEEYLKRAEDIRR